MSLLDRARREGKLIFNFRIRALLDGYSPNALNTPLPPSPAPLETSSYVLSPRSSMKRDQDLREKEERFSSGRIDSEDSPFTSSEIARNFTDSTIGTNPDNSPVTKFGNFTSSEREEGEGADYLEIETVGRAREESGGSTGPSKSPKRTPRKKKGNKKKGVKW